MIENVTQYVLGICIGCIINDSEYNKEVLEHFIDKLNKLNDSIKAKVDDYLASILYGGSPRSVA